jgi:uncharacterized phiE125 gp8 family phage protein
MALRLYTAPAAEPVTVAQLKDYLRVSHDAENTLIVSLGKSARAWVESYLRRALINQTWKLTLDCFPAQIELKMCPVSSITHVKYYNTAGVLTTLAVNTDYVYDLTEEPVRIIPAYGTSWPTTRSGLLAQVEVQFVAGYGTAGTTVPDAILTAIKALVAHWYQNREAVGLVGTEQIPLGIRSLLNPYRLFTF